MLRPLIVLGLLVLLVGCGGTADRQVATLSTQTPADQGRTTQASPTTGSSTPPTVGSGPTEVGVQPATATVHGHSDSPNAGTEADLAALLAHAPGQFDGYTLTLGPSTIQTSYAHLAIPVAETGLNVRFEDIPDSLGSADISLYTDRAMLTDAYTRLIQVLETSEPATSGQPVPGLGDQATQQIVEEGRIHSRSIFFVRCGALVEVSLLATSSVDTTILLDYAKTIDQRIQDSPRCP